MDVIKDLAYYETHVEEFDKLSGEEQDKLTTDVGGDDTIGGEGGKGDEVVVVKEKEDEVVVDPTLDADGNKIVVDPELDADGKPVELEKVIISKSGKEEIPYSRLEEQEEKVRQLTEELAANKGTMETLKTDLAEAKLADEETGGDEAQKLIVSEFAKDYPSLSEAVNLLIGGRVDELEAKINSVVDEKIKPLEDSSAANAQETHLALIAEKHPDYAEIVSSGKLERFIDSLPSYMQGPTRDLLTPGSTGGNSAQIIELFDNYKLANPAEAAPDKTEAEKKAAKVEANKKIAAAKEKETVPDSLSEINGSAPFTTENERLAVMTDGQLSDSFAGKSPKQIEEALNKML